MKILIGGAWVYANGSLHIGHVAGLLSGDIIARYHRLIGDEVCYVSGSDCHGTPISIRAIQDNKSPYEISEKYHNEFIKDFEYLSFSYDYYGKTTSNEHKEFVKEFHEKLYNSKYIYEKESPQAYCRNCNKFLPDRLLIGECNNCRSTSRGDQCENCGQIFENDELVNPRCSQCNSQPEFISTKHLYIAISKLENHLVEFLKNGDDWKDNAISFTKRYIKEGLRDRAITRDLDWGIDVPKDGYEDKKIYIWAENVLGYLSSCLVYCKKNNLYFDSYYKNLNAKQYYCHGKDNIPFHSIILPSLLIAVDENYNLPNTIVSSEYLTLEGKKISTSQNWAIWIKDLIGKYNSDSIRYFLTTNAPEKRDADFSWREFVYSNNSELLGAYGNFVNRNLVFINKSFSSRVPQGIVESNHKKKIEYLYKEVGELITKGELKRALDNIFEFIRYSNKYFDEEKPWITIKEDISKCENTLFNCVFIITNLAILLEPFLPKSSDKIISWFKLPKKWKLYEPTTGYMLPKISILFERLDKSVIADEVELLEKHKYDNNLFI